MDTPLDNISDDIIEIPTDPADLVITDTGMHIHDVEVSTSAPDFFKVIENRYILVNDTLLVYQLDERVIDLLDTTLKGQVNGINICQVPTEIGSQAYYDYASELIKYIIFQQQNEIVFSNLFFINEFSQFHQMAVKAVKDNQRKITKNSYTLFPKDDEACFNIGMTQYHFTCGYKDDYHRSWFGEEAAYDMQVEYIPVGKIEPTEEPYVSDGRYYEPDPDAMEEEGGDDSGGGGGDSEGGDDSGGGEGGEGGEEDTRIPYRIVWNHETYTIPLKAFYAQCMGVFTSAVQTRTATITVKHKVRPDEYHKIDP